MSLFSRVFFCAVIAAFLVALVLPFFIPPKKYPLITEKTAKSVKVIDLAVPQINLAIANPDPPQDFSSIANVKEKKIAFFSYFLPLVEAHNEWISENRKFITAYLKMKELGQPIDKKAGQHVKYLFKRYKINIRGKARKADFQLLLKRMDILPVNLVLIQAANESGWGSSRFAKQGQNYFGQWCYKPGCGLVPINRVEGLTHEVAKYDNPYQALSNYFRNVNTNAAYRVLRDMRANYRRLDMKPTAEILATGLMSYSERGADYVQDILSMLRTNKTALAAARQRLELSGFADNETL
ncbi:glucosaminidase domain-containing protein [Catenovulum sediminis]|uniref:Glucosaminidase domain-containing protein n=1 Tax=Catenovulum sediminis TaxID=1740262 RepID=A0ABV1RLA5_9ALTE|nr:glucosaminidase domain-containing protein [Catenovulum sediminis]